MMTKTILLVAIGALLAILLMIAYGNFNSAGKLCDRIIDRSNRIIRALKSVKRDLKPKKRRK